MLFSGKTGQINFVFTVFVSHTMHLSAIKLDKKKSTKQTKTKTQTRIPMWKISTKFIFSQRVCIVNGKSNCLDYNDQENFSTVKSL